MRALSFGMGVGVGVSVAWYILRGSRLATAATETERFSTKRGNREQAGCEELDTAGAELRVIRKAEAVIQRRTEQIILVVERCTATHNYTAAIRTAEALGIQHVWLVAPPSKVSSLSLPDSYLPQP